MIYPDVSTEYWIEKYNLRVKVKRCSCCGKYFKTIVPILIKGYAGLETPAHGCDRHFSAAVFTPIKQDTIASWTELLCC